MTDRCLDPTCPEHWPTADPCGHDCQVGTDDAPLSDPAKAWQCTVCGTVLG